MKSEINWQTGTPLKTGIYLITVSYGNGIYGTRSDYYHTADGWNCYDDGYDDGSVVAWCDIKSIEPYKPKSNERSKI